MKFIRIENKSSPLKDNLSVKVCETFFSKLRCLMFTEELQKSEGLIFLNPVESRINTSIHMFGVAYDLGIIWINLNKRIVDIYKAKKKFDIRFPKKPAAYIIEIHPDRLGEFNIGDEIEFIES